jgi:hypothetical protein
MPPFNSTEQEAIVLKAVWDMIDGMVNWEMFARPDNEVKNVALLPATSTHQRLFNILLLDFLTVPNVASFDLSPPPNGGSASDKSYLFYISRIGEAPTLNTAGGKALIDPVIAFVQWLECDCAVEDVWLPSINAELNITLKRIQFIKICGNIAKHSFAGLSWNSKEIAEILAANGVTVNDDQRFLVIPEFYDWFHRGIMNYHISAIAEFLNNIRYGIHEYLKPEWERSYTKDQHDPVRYSYKVPGEITRELPKSMYWDLMDAVRGSLNMPRFEVTPYLKMRY